MEQEYIISFKGELAIYAESKEDALEMIQEDVWEHPFDVLDHAEFYIEEDK